MIPKVIHYCWFGKGEMPPVVKYCIEGWSKILKGYDFILWNEENFDIESTSWTKTAYNKGKYAFVSDYVRLKALYDYGGIYMDSDMKLLKSFDNMLDNGFVASSELYPETFLKDYHNINPKTLLPYEENHPNTGFGIAAAPILAEVHHPYIEECLKWYNNKEYCEEDIYDVVINGIMTKTAEKFGFKYTPSEQYIPKYRMRIYEPKVFVLNSLHLCSSSVTIHLSLGSWKEENGNNSLRDNFTPLWYFIYFPLKNRLRRIKQKFMSKDKLKTIYALETYKNVSTN